MRRGIHRFSLLSATALILLVMTNSRRVWRQNTRGDFWTYDLASGRLRKLGPGFEPSTLMFAKLSTIGSIGAVSARLPLAS
jgi:dipeptidyl-peptidase-4